MTTTPQDADTHDWVEVPCNLCEGAGDVERLFARGTYVHVRCRRCSLVWVSPRPPMAEQVNARLYGQDHDGLASFCRELLDMSPEQVAERRAELRDRAPRKYRAELAGLERRLGKAGRLLDVGCANGRFLLAAEGRGWEVTGIEVAPEQATVAREKFGLDVHCGTLETAGLEVASVDAVRLNQVLEHVPDPLGTLRAIARVLRPGGLFSMSTVNIDSFTYRLLGSEWSHLGTERNGHIFFFSPRTLTEMLQRAGFRVVGTRTVGCRLTNHAERPEGARRRAKGLRRRAVRIAEQLLELPARPLLKGGRIYVLAERTGT